LLTLSPPKTQGRWKPGQSGNPGGKNQHSHPFDAAALARSHAPEAINALVIALRYPTTRVPAAIALLDRGFGKPQVNIRSEHDVNVLHLVAAQALGLELQQQPPAKPTIEHQVDAAELPKE